MYQVILTLDAERDIYQDVLYIRHESGSKETAQKYLDILETAILSLAEFPERGANPRHKILRGQRYRFLVAASHLVFYKVNQEKHEVIIYRVLHNKSSYQSFL